MAPRTLKPIAHYTMPAQCTAPVHSCGVVCPWLHGEASHFSMLKRPHKLTGSTVSEGHLG